MIEKMMPVEIPPGIVMNGTMFQRAGRWAGGNLVRWEQGVPKALGGTASITASAGGAGTTIPTGRPTGAYGFYNGSTGTPMIVYSTRVSAGVSKVVKLVYNSGTFGDFNDITPAAAADEWSFAHLGGTILMNPKGGGIYESTGAAGTSTTAPGAYVAVGVTPEQFVVGLTSGNVVQWASQGTTTTWTPTSVNSAGSLTLQTQGSLKAIRNTRGGALIWTTQDLWQLNYVGAPLYYGATQVAVNCGLASARAVVMLENGTAYWMTERGFASYAGYMRDVPCEISDAIFGDINGALLDHVFALVNGPWNEIWWFWPSASGTEADRVAIYNWVEKAWSLGTITRNAGVDSGFWGFPGAGGRAYNNPMLFTTGAVYAHEQGGAISGAYLESGPIMLDPAQNQLMRLQKIVPDNNETATNETLTLYTGTWPKVAETSATYTIDAAGGPIDLRVNARYARLKLPLTRADSRIGVPRLGVVPAETR